METFKTKDFYLACTLQANGVEFVRSEKVGLNTVFFFFDITDKEDLHFQILSDFVNCNSTVNVKKFTMSIKKFRNEIKKLIDNGGNE